ncbi:MAG: helix-turn-helix transcriptional regulator, partial [Lachnospiraceae bacterium]|nr:helix-turn-helix transcriptional regulator [Lachnospiraceae bacterium]
MTDDTGKRIKARRKDLGMTQEELGQKAGVTKATINKYETGIVQNLKRSTIEDMAKALNVSPSYIMGWTDNVAEVHTNNGVIGQNS